MKTLVVRVNELVGKHGIEFTGSEHHLEVIIALAQKLGDLKPRPTPSTPEFAGGYHSNDGN